MAKAYERRLSSTEAHEGRIMVLKSALRPFPPPGEQSKLTAGASRFVISVRQ